MRDIWRICGVVYLGAVIIFFGVRYEMVWWIGGLGELERVLSNYELSDWMIRAALFIPGILLLFHASKRSR